LETMKPGTTTTLSHPLDIGQGFARPYHPQDLSSVAEVLLSRANFGRLSKEAEVAIVDEIGAFLGRSLCPVLVSVHHVPVRTSDTAIKNSTQSSDWVAACIVTVIR